MEDGTAKLIINKQTGQWGTQYDQKQDLARIDLKKDTLDKTVDQFTMAIEPNRPRRRAENDVGKHRLRGVVHVKK